MIELIGLSKAYGQTQVVNQASALFPLGKVTAIIGPNGAGKSTLLSMASRLTDSDAGEVLIGDKPLSEWSNEALAKRLAVLRQANNVNMRFRVRELVAFGRFPHSKGRLSEQDNAMIDDALAQLGLTELQDRFIDQLSGGQRQMAFIAMVVAQNTDYVFLDEPLNNLDIRHSVAIMKTIRELAHRYNKAVVVVMHDINFGACYADNMIAMKAGEVVASGRVKDVVTKPIMEQIYEIDFEVEEINGQRICLYYGVATPSPSMAAIES
ncbi:iron ABC transporter ATP-binding protein [Salinivibrio kushneri]|uniref:iron ABC transporter ATP-binding protein n=1 Tax=Salinivibrio kushneri TaxID=1908198 RepID=UPI0009892362|nr:ATP-binding cassette domain-containing protein [Salinivibrio kushneri]OOE35397.1 iron ABC transporter ATP-binding protein [Salinivibrio kushneri]OOE37939.1 iron ABC transporter ATP-binding protein [Salinivibrio kushneri]